MTMTSVDRTIFQCHCEHPLISGEISILVLIFQHSSGHSDKHLFFFFHPTQIFFAPSALLITSSISRRALGGPEEFHSSTGQNGSLGNVAQIHGDNISLVSEKPAFAAQLLMVAMASWLPIVADDVGLFAIDLQKGIARRVVKLFSSTSKTRPCRTTAQPLTMIVFRRSRSWMPNNLHCFNTVAAA